MMEFARIAKGAGANGVIANPMVTGFGALEDLASGALNLPIIATNIGAAFFSKGAIGGTHSAIAESLIAKLTRMAGADAVHGGILGSDWYRDGPPDGVKSALSGPIAQMLGSYRVVAGGVNVVNLMQNWPFEGEHLLIEAGSSVFGHPNGPRAGMRALNSARDIAEKVFEKNLERSEAVELGLAYLLRRSEDDNDVEQAIYATKWKPTPEVDKKRRNLTADSKRRATR